MAWRLFRFIYGPGHQGTHEEYRWYDYKPSEEELKDTCHEIAHDRYIEDWICKDAGKVVRKLPEKVRKEKIEHYAGWKRHAEAMLKILGA